MKTKEEKYGWLSCKEKKIMEQVAVPNEKKQFINNMYACERPGRAHRNASQWGSFADKAANVALVIGAIFVVSLFLRALMW
jgi:hypothetical protein